jgi:hypothetical protein
MNDISPFLFIHFFVVVANEFKNNSFPEQNREAVMNAKK